MGMAMNLKNLATALGVAAGMSLTWAAAVPAAHADPSSGPSPAPTSQLDQQFLQVLKDQRINVKSDGFALGLAHSTCDELKKTQSVANTLSYIKDQTGWTSIDQIGKFGSLSVQAYCKSSLPAT
jgi:hypothetical protein